MATNRASELMAKAKAATSLNKFGEDSFREGLEILVDSLDREARLSHQQQVKRDIARYLKERQDRRDRAGARLSERPASEPARQGGAGAPPARISLEDEPSSPARQQGTRRGASRLGAARSREMRPTAASRSALRSSRCCRSSEAAIALNSRASSGSSACGE